jgi:hypothetical protein
MRLLTPPQNQQRSKVENPGSFCLPDKAFSLAWRANSADVAHCSAEWEYLIIVLNANKEELQQTSSREPWRTTDGRTLSVYKQCLCRLNLRDPAALKNLRRAMLCLHGKMNRPTGDIVGIAQTILSAVLIFLFLLVLRNYFRIK